MVTFSIYGGDYYRDICSTKGNVFFQDCYFKGGCFYYSLCSSCTWKPDFTTLGSVQTWWGKKDPVLQIRVFWNVSTKFFHCFSSCREAHIWTGISKSKCQGLSRCCTGVPGRLCHVVLCSNLWALNLAQSLGYLSSSAPLCTPCFSLVWLHFILVHSTGFTAHPRH